MILLRILEHDLHRSRQGDAVPLCVGVPAKPEFLPAIVTNSKGKFVAIDHLGPSKGLKGLIPNVPWDDNSIYGLVFSWDPDRIDDVVGDMCSAAYELSVSKQWGNVFSGRSAARRAFDYISSSSGLAGQPHVCLVPEGWSSPKIRRFFGQANLDAQQRKYRRYCRIVPSKTGIPVFLSRPDFVGMYTQFMGGSSSIVLHNVCLGMSFCP